MNYKDLKIFAETQTYLWPSLLPKDSEETWVNVRWKIQRWRDQYRYC